MDEFLGPQHGPAPIPKQRAPYDFSKFNRLMSDLQEWRNDDHEDHITLHRSHIIEIIEGVNALQRGAPSK